MAHPLILIGLTAIGGLGTGMYVSKSGTESPDLTARIAGVPAVPALAIGGGALALMGGPFLMPLGLGIVVGSLVSGDGLKRVKAGLDGYIAAQVQARMAPGGQLPPGAPAPPALPGPTGPTGPTGAPGAELLRLVSPLVNP